MRATSVRFDYRAERTVNFLFRVPSLVRRAGETVHGQMPVPGVANSQLEPDAGLAEMTRTNVLLLGTVIGFIRALI